MNIQNFWASNVKFFKTRHSIIFKGVTGEKSSADTASAEEWKARLSSIIQNFDRKDIFNMDKTALLYKMLSVRTLAEKTDDCSGENYHSCFVLQ